MKKVRNIKTKYGAIYSLGILAILTLFAITFPAKVNAEPGYVNAYSNAVIVPETPVEVRNPKPALASISPNSGNRNSGGRTIIITGNGFMPSSIAKVNGSNHNTNFIDYSHLLVEVNANDMNRPDGFFVSVFNGAPAGGYSNAIFFTIKNTATPSVTTNANSNTNNGYSSYTNNNTNNTFSSDTTETQTENQNDTNNNYSDLASNAIFGSDNFTPSGLIQWVLLAIIILIIVILVRKIFGGEARYHATPLKHD